MVSRTVLRYSKSLAVLYHTGSNAWRTGALSRAAAVGLSVVFNLLTSGVIYGFPALAGTLAFNGSAFSTLCLDGEELPCAAQERWIAFTITVAMSACSGAAFPAGVVLDYAGPRMTICIASLIFASGLVSIAFGHSTSNLAYIYGFFALAVGGTTISTSMTNFAELYSTHAAAIISVQNGAYQLSSVVILVFHILISRYGFTFQEVFLSYTAVPVVIFVTSLLLFPRKAYGIEEGPKNFSESHRTWLIRRILVARQQVQEEDLKTTPLLKEDQKIRIFSTLTRENSFARDTVPRPPQLYNVDFRSQAMSLPFLGITMVLSYFILLMNFNLTTLGDQVFQEAVNSGMPRQAAMEEAAEYTSAFSLLLPLGGALFVPAVSYILQRLGLAPAFACGGGLLTVFSMTILPNVLPMEAKWLGYAAFSMARPLVFSSLAAYIAGIFGFVNFGKLFGLAQFGVLLTAPLQYGLVNLAKGFFKGQYFWVNFFLLVLGICTFSTFTLYAVKTLFCGFFIRPTLPDREEGEEDDTLSQIEGMSA